MTPEISPPQDHARHFHDFRSALESRMRLHLEAPDAPVRLMAASSDAVMSSGKRMRPFILHLVAGDARDAVLDAGCALEMVHSASLILDDLPCMDDAALRRGRPATHVAYGQATAILGSVGLLNQAFALVGQLEATDADRIALVAALSRSVGWGGLVAGQELDVNGFDAGDISESKCNSAIRRIDRVNRLKTGVLLVAAVEMGAVLAGFAPARREGLVRFAQDLGQAFQIADDLGDRRKTTAEAGKDTGKDAGKSNFVAEMGEDRAMRRCLDLLLRAGHALEAAQLDPAPFHWMIGQVFDADILAARVGKMIAVLVVIATVAFMEFFAWWAHKYIMHGWGWGWHKSHHEERHGAFEMNDLYAVVFAFVAIGLFALGEWSWRPATWLAIGVTLYGVLYFVAHDGLVHKRWPFNYIPRKGYAKRLYQAHRLHHAVEGKEGCVSFGFIYAKPVKVLVKELDHNRKIDRAALDEVQDGR